MMESWNIQGMVRVNIPSTLIVSCLNESETDGIARNHRNCLTASRCVSVADSVVTNHVYMLW